LIGWPNFTFDCTQQGPYQEALRLAPNTGVLLGTASGNLCTVDADDDQYLAEFLELNPALASFVTRGNRGGQVWMYLVGEYPHRVQTLKSKDGDHWGEFRSDGGQSVIRGIHPSGNHYVWMASNPPPKIQFSDIKWPDTLILSWQEEARAAAPEKDKEPEKVTTTHTKSKRIILEKRTPIQLPGLGHIDSDFARALGEPCIRARKAEQIKRGLSTRPCQWYCPETKERLPAGES
jgi:Bifunctional DNA primase/polymerase, N-terminal